MAGKKTAGTRTSPYSKPAPPPELGDKDDYTARAMDKGLPLPRRKR